MLPGQREEQEGTGQQCRTFLFGGVHADHQRGRHARPFFQHPRSPATPSRVPVTLPRPAEDAGAAEHDRGDGEQFVAGARVGLGLPEPRPCRSARRGRRSGRPARKTKPVRRPDRQARVARTPPVKKPMGAERAPETWCGAPAPIPRTRPRAGTATPASAARASAPGRGRGKPAGKSV